MKVLLILNKVWLKYNLIKLQNANYQLAQVVGTEQNIFKGILYLYQIDKLANYFANNLDFFDQLSTWLDVHLFSLSSSEKL